MEEDSILREDLQMYSTSQKCGKS